MLRQTWVIIALLSLFLLKGTGPEVSPQKYE